MGRQQLEVGFTLQPEERFVELLEPLICEHADYLEVVPETLMARDREGHLCPNRYHGRFLELGQRHGMRFVAHGVGLSLGTLAASDGARFDAMLKQIEVLHQNFDFQWYTDHLAASVLGDQDLVLPLAIPLEEAVASHVRGRLLRLQEIVGLAGVENTVTYFNLMPAMEEPAFLTSVLDAEGLVLLLDLHNLYTMALNQGFDAEQYLAELPLERVIEIHISGGAESDPAWLPEGRSLRLDSHDAAVPEAVWGLLERALPRCPGLRGVTLERMEGTVQEGDVAGIEGELLRLRGMLA